MLHLFSILTLMLSLGCFFVVLVHAFRLGAGPGFMVLLIPGYNLYYGFSQFQHRYKGWILAGWVGLFGLGLMLRVTAHLLAMSPS